MSWVDKAHRKHKVDKLVKEVLSNPEYKKMQQQEDLKCFSCLALISVDFMMRKHGYGKKRIQEYVEFLKKQLGYVTEDEEYFKLLNMEIEEDTGVNVLRELDIAADSHIAFWNMYVAMGGQGSIVDMIGQSMAYLEEHRNWDMNCMASAMDMRDCYGKIS